MMFSNLIGNSYAKQILSRMVAAGKVPHALLLSGPSGVGKKCFALEMVKAIFGPSHARKVDSGHHPDLRIFSPEGKSGMHPLSTIHQLQEQMALQPFEACARVYIIEDADRMLTTSSNALLKTLEEPQENNYLILLTCHENDMLPTILSRCRKVPFFSIEDKLICQYLQERYNISREEAQKITFLSHGSLEKCIDLMGSKSDAKSRCLIEILSSRRYEGAQLSALIDDLEKSITEKTSEDPNRFFMEVDHLLEEIYYWYRDIHLLSLGVNSDKIFHLEALDILQTMDVKKSLPLEKIGVYLEECRLSIHRTIKLKTALEYLFSQLICR